MSAKKKRKSDYAYDEDKKEKLTDIADKISWGMAAFAAVMVIITAIAAVNHEAYADSDAALVWETQYERARYLKELKTAAGEPETEETAAEEETTVFVTPVEDLGDPTQAAYEETTTSDNSILCILNESEGTAVAWDDEFTLLCRMVRIEMGEGSGEEYYNACYLQAATALNRLEQGWAATLTEVLMQEGQFYGYGYHTWDWSQININVPDLQQAVLDCMAYNDTPENLVFADSRHNHEGTDIMEFYAEICGQDFYLSK